MPDIYHYRHTIADAEIDSLGHANNVAYVQWMQAAALAHSAAQGWPTEKYRELGLGWVVRSHTIEYCQPGRRGELIVVRTWVATMKKVTSIRRYHIVRQLDDAVLAKAETKWAFINYATGQPAAIPAEIAQAFHVIEP
jgi:acyl-CoA thioester hydrolase